MATTSDQSSPNNAGRSALLDLSSLHEYQRVEFYGAMFAIAAVDGVMGQDELDLIFQNIDIDGLSELSRQRIWDYLVDAPPLTDCLACFATSHDQVRCTLMVYLVEIALADRILDTREDEALLLARRSLRISQRQIEAIERYLVECGLIRARPRDYNEGTTSLKYKYGILLVAGLSITGITLYLSSTMGGVSLPGMLSMFALPRSGLAVALGAGATILIGAAAVLSGRWLYTRIRRNYITLAPERRRRAHLAVHNLQDAIE
jgi:uncharacterized tellurite resistance protein B-like protein